MRARRVVLVGLAAALVTTACASVLKSDERAWCGEHPQEVVAASYTIGEPMTLTDALADAEADIPSPGYIRACRAALRGR
jgi:hypothetical protein